MYNKKVWNTGERITADKLNNIEEGVYSNALVNKTQQVYINGLFNENKDGRLSVEGEGNDLKLEGSKEGLVEVDRVVGNTFVNLANTKTSGSFLGTSRNVRINTKNTVPMMKANTDYTVFFTISDLNLDGLSSISLQVEIPKFGLTGNHIKDISSNGNYCAKFTTGEMDTESSYTYVALKGVASQWVDGNTTRTLTLSNCILLEGDYTNKPIPSEHIEGLQSSFEENLVTQEMVEQGLESEENLGKYKVPVRIVGKNLLPCLVPGYISSANGLFDDSSTTAVRSDYIKLDSSKEYFISGLDNRYSSFVSFYDLNKKWLGRTSGNKRSSIAIPNNPTNLNGELIGNYSYIAITQYSISIPITEFITNNSIQIEEGTVATDCEDYFERTTNVYLNSPLLEGDEIVMYNGELCHYHKRCRESYNGSDDENWLTYNKKTNTNTFKIEIPKILAVRNSDFSCDKYTNADIVGSYDGEGICVYDNKYIYLGLLNTKANTVLECKQYLQSNPFLFEYQLAEPYYEPIQADKLLLECANDSTLHIESIVPVESVKASYTGNVPSVYAIEEINQTQDSLIDISLCATDEMYTMIEPLLSAVPQTLNNERMISKMVDMYVAMVIRGLKTIDEVPVRYREQVKEILAQLEK